MARKTTPKEIQYKKIKVQQQEVITLESGERIQANTITFQDRDFNFTKIWWKSLVSALDIVSNKKLKVVWWIIDHLDSSNRLIATLPEISVATGISIGTVRATVATLVEADFLRKLNKIGGAYQVNPSMIFRGTHEKRMNVLWRYESVDDVFMVTNKSIREKKKDTQLHETEDAEKTIPGQTKLMSEGGIEIRQQADTNENNINDGCWIEDE